MAKNKVITFLSKVILKGIIFSYIPGELGLIQQFFSEGVDQAFTWSESKVKTEKSLEHQLEALFATDHHHYTEIEYYQSQIQDILTSVKVPLDLYLNEAALPQYLIQGYKKTHPYPEDYEQIRKILKYLAPVIAETGRDSKYFYPKILSDILTALEEQKIQIQVQGNDIDEIRRLLKNYKRYESGNCIKDCTLEYKNRWTESMFLHRDSLKMSQITLKNLYNNSSQIPSYTLRGNSQSGLHNVLYDLEKPLLILGQPGIGKSTLITWLLNNNQTQREIIVYRFSDSVFAGWEPGAKKTAGDYLLENASYKCHGEEFPLTVEKLENSFLVLDGFDEMAVDGDRVEFLNELYTFWNTTKRFPLVITCREHYISSVDLYRLQFPCITLQPWGKEQISRFAEDYQHFSGEAVSGETIKLAQNYRTDRNDHNIFGIPLILYMVLSLKIKLEAANSIVDVYDRIFQINGGIYDYCVKTDEQLSDSKAYAIDKMRLGVTQKKTIHQMSRDIALWMFEHEPERACIPKKNYGEIPHLSKDSDLLSASYFNEFKMAHHTDGMESNELRFVHRSMYQYFIAEGFCRQAETILSGSTDKKMPMEYLLSTYFKGSRIDSTIQEYLSYILKKQYEWKTADEKKAIYTWWEEQAVSTLSEGICYCANIPRQPIQKEIRSETTGAANIFSLLHIVREVCEYPKKILQHAKEKGLLATGATSDTLNTTMNAITAINDRNLNSRALNTLGISYWETLDFPVNSSLLNVQSSFSAPSSYENIVPKIIRHLAAERTVVDATEFDFSGFDLSGVDFRFFSLQNTVFTQSNLAGAILSDMMLNKANFRDAELNSAILQNSDLAYADLRNAVLTGADLNNAHIKTSQINETDFTVANFQTIFVKGKGTTSGKKYSRSQFLKQFYPQKSIAPQGSKERSKIYDSKKS